MTKSNTLPLHEGSLSAENYSFLLFLDIFYKWNYNIFIKPMHIQMNFDRVYKFKKTVGNQG